MPQLVIYGPKGTGCTTLAERIRRENGDALQIRVVYELTVEDARRAVGTMPSDTLYIPAPLNSLGQWPLDSQPRFPTEAAAPV